MSKRIKHFFLAKDLKGEATELKKFRLVLRKLYFSPLGYCISGLMQLLAKTRAPFMVYGFRDSKRNAFRKHTRVSSSAIITAPSAVSLGDHCWIGHHCILDGTFGIDIGTGVQLAFSVGVYTHSSHISIRLLGESYINTDFEDRVGYQSGEVCIGDFTYVGSGAQILPGVKLGKGCVVSAGTVVSRSFDDYSVIAGNPAQRVGDTREIDAAYLADHTLLNYYDPSLKQRLHVKENV